MDRKWSETRQNKDKNGTWMEKVTYGERKMGLEGIKIGLKWAQNEPKIDAK